MTCRPGSEEALAMLRWIGACLVAAALLGFGLAPAAGQAEPVEVILKLARGETVFYTQTEEHSSAFQLPDRILRNSSRTEGRTAYRVLDVDGSGIMLLEAVVEDVRVTSEGKTTDLFDDPWLIKVRPDGKINEKLIGAEGIDDFPAALPGKPVAAGETWTRQETITQENLTGRGTTTYTVAGIEGAGSDRIARIRVRSEASLSGGSPIPLPAGVTGRTQGTSRGTAEIEWSVERGRPLRTTEEVTLDLQVELSGQGQTVRVRSTSTSTIRREPLASFTPPTVAADLLIAPGKAIGPTSLEQAVVDLMTRLGNPETAEPVGAIKAARLRWRDAPEGYVDPADRTKLLALTIADSRYRTEKGIGFGSSEGAVLLAYGMAPARLDFQIPNVGGVRLLIYNDLGIAFAITSDKQHAERGPGHAPLGAVDWITVFPSGGAGRIYTLP